MKKFKCFLFIDSDTLANAYHKKMLEESTLVEKLIFFTDPIEGLEYLKQVEEKGLTKPDVLFFDIDTSENLGWEALEFCSEMLCTWHTHIIILSLFLKPQDLQITMESDFINGFHYKPLSLDYVKEMLSQWEWEE